MKEHDRILETVKKHQKYFDTRPADVAISIKGEYFFYEEEPEYGGYSIFTRFETAEELESLLMENIATDFCVSLTNIAESVYLDLNPHHHEHIEVEENPTLSCEDQLALIRSFESYTKAIQKSYKQLVPLLPWIKSLSNE